MTRWMRAACSAGAMMLAGGVVFATREAGQARFLAAEKYEDVYYLPPPAWLSAISLGHKEALADLLWLRSLVYFADELDHKGEVKHLYDYTDAMLRLDPQFRKVYLWVSSCALYRTGTITDRDARNAIAYLERAVRLFPDDGELAWTLGATYLYELVPLLSNEADQLEAKRQGLEHLKVAAMRGAGPRWLALTTAAELGKLGQTEQEITHLEQVYGQVSDPTVKTQIEMRLARLRSSAYAEALRRTFSELEAARARDFPYLDRELYLLVGKRPPFDGTALLLRDFDPEADRFDDTQLASVSGAP
jgi:hypothetical protein